MQGSEIPKKAPCSYSLHLDLADVGVRHDCEVYVGGCQNYGPFLAPYYNTASSIYGTQKETIILVTALVHVR